MRLFSVGLAIVLGLISVGMCSAQTQAEQDAHDVSLAKHSLVVYQDGDLSTVIFDNTVLYGDLDAEKVVVTDQDDLDFVNDCLENADNANYLAEYMRIQGANDMTYGSTSGFWAAAYADWSAGNWAAGAASYSYCTNAYWDQAIADQNSAYVHAFEAASYLEDAGAVIASY